MKVSVNVLEITNKEAKLVVILECSVVLHYILNTCDQFYVEKRMIVKMRGI